MAPRLQLALPDPQRLHKLRIVAANFLDEAFRLLAAGSLGHSLLPELIVGEGSELLRHDHAHIREEEGDGPGGEIASHERSLARSSRAAKA